MLESLRCRIKACKFIKRLRHRCFVVNFEKFLRMIFCRTNAILLLFCLLFFGQIIERFLNNTFLYVESIIFAVFQKQLFADVLQNRCSLKLCNSHRKQLCRIFWVNKVAGLRAGTLLWKRFQHKCFPVNFLKVYKKIYFVEDFRAAASAF